jgi:hypothetical protein
MFNVLGGGLAGMQVVVDGLSAAGTSVQRKWTLQAPVLNGPETPCMAAILLTRRLARGEHFQAGAFPCMGWLSLSEFTPLFTRWGITQTIERR